MNLMLCYAKDSFLEENEFKVDSFTDPLLALQNFKEQDGMYDIIILDIKMPEMNCQQ
ncbi:MAG TPA: hypothetical protein VKA98_02075 [Nitrososphaeraceae archaeon]|nr:hypothetical protein [Nitrososphaeraceae archaeon]